MRIGPDARVLFGAVLSAEDWRISVGDHSVVMENAVIRGRARHPAVIGDAVLVGPHAHVNGARVGDGCFLATGDALFPGCVAGAGSEVASFAYSGDTQWTAAPAEAAHGADLFAVEAYTYDGPVRYHLDYQTVRAHLGEICARRIVLTHISAAKLTRLADASLPAAYDGMTVDLWPGRYLPTHNRSGRRPVQHTVAGLAYLCTAVPRRECPHMPRTGRRPGSSYS